MNCRFRTETNPIRSTRCGCRSLQVPPSSSTAACGTRGGRNHSTSTRIALYYGYSYRWLKPRDDMTVGDLLDRCDPIRRQLLGDSVTGNHSFTSPAEEDAPLRAWISEHAGEGAVVP